MAKAFIKLIINADDFGLCKGTTYGIYDSIANGIVTSTTYMTNMDFSSATAKMFSSGDFGIGLHFNLTLGKPLTNGRTLAENGHFIKPKNLKTDEIYDPKEIEEEFYAQLEVFKKNFGRMPTHIDSHLYAHQRLKRVKAVTKKLAEKVDLPLRGEMIGFSPHVKFVDTFKIKEGETHLDAAEKFEKIICDNLNETYVELMTHPALMDDFLLNESSYNLARLIELKVMTSERAKEFLKIHNVELINYGEI